MSHITKTKVDLHGANIGSCGYCKEENVRVGVSKSYGMTSLKMSVSEYESLMLIGWRRSGTYFYKPTMHTTCCPQYTIRLKATSFRESKSLRQISRRFDRYLNTGDIHEMPSEPSSGPASGPLPMVFTVDVLPANFTDEKFELYKKYQVTVHHDNPEEITKTGFTSFLVNSPLIDDISADKRYGTFHQEYRINGLLIAVGVIDIVPSGLSSVYMLYDPEYRFISLGKYTALKDIEYCKEKGLEYYYMGFYIHSCVKMRYKGEFHPSELLCPTSLQWFPLQDCSLYLNKFKFTPLDPLLAAEWARMVEGGVETNVAGATVDLTKFKPQFNPMESSLNDISISIQGRVISYKDLREGQTKTIVKRILMELLENCRVDIISRFIVNL